MFTSLFILTPQSDEGTSANFAFYRKFFSLVTGAQIVNISELTQQDGRGKKTANLV